MRVLQISASYKPAYIYGGPIISVANLSEQLAENNYTVEVFTTTANGANELDVMPNTPTIVNGVKITYFKRITKDHSHFSPRLLSTLWKQIRRFDAIHIHAWWNTVSVLSALIALMRGVPLVISPRGTLSDYSFHNRNSFYKTCIHNVLGKTLLNRSYIHATSQHEVNALQLIISPKHIFNIPNLITLQPPAVDVATQTDNNLQLLFFSRIEEKKGLDILLHALAGVKIPFHLTIAGDGNENYINQLKQIADGHQLSVKISWIGFQSENKFSILQQHHLLVLPSYDENFGNVVIESLGVGTPVLISEQVGLANYVKENNLGWICKTEPESITTIINNITLPQLATIRSKAPQIIYRDFNAENLLTKYTAMYQQVIKQNLETA